jgi:hypothetical protein
MPKRRRAPIRDVYATVLSNFLPFDLVEYCLSLGPLHNNPNWDELVSPDTVASLLVHMAMFMHDWIDMIYMLNHHSEEAWIRFSNDQTASDEIYKELHFKVKGDTFRNYFQQYKDHENKIHPNDSRMLKEIERDNINFSRFQRVCRKQFFIL